MTTFKQLLKLNLYIILMICSGNIFAQAPGGVSPNLRLWLKADAGVTTTAGYVSGWLDYSGLANNITGVAGTNAAVLTPNKLNGKPVLTFAGTGGLNGNFVTPITTSSTSSAFIVTKANTATNRGLFATGNAATDHGTTNAAVQFIASNTGVSVGGYRTAFRANYTNANSVTNYHLYTSIYNATQNLFYNEGAPATNVTYAQQVYNLTKYSVSGWYSAGTHQAFCNGEIAEVIFYDRALTAVEQNQIQGYLALKYGFTLSQTTATDYLNSSSAIIYNSGTGGTHAGYASNVVGIGVDNGTGFNQSESRSVVNPMFGISNPSTAFVNGEYIIAGDNGISESELRATDVPAGYGSRLQKAWRVSKSAVAGTVTIKMYVGAIPEFLGTASLANVAILTSSSNNFSSANAYGSPTLSGVNNDTLEFNNVVLNNNDYFTLSLGANTPNADFAFWFGVPQWSPQYSFPQRIHLTGASPTLTSQYIIDQPANPSFVPITGTLAPAAAQIIDMSPFVFPYNSAADQVVTLPANTVVNRGLRISVKGQMGAYYTNEMQANYQSFPLRGPNALGTSFYIPGQNISLNGSYPSPSTSEFIVTATKNNTKVTIVPSMAIVGHGANAPFTITLNKGQSYQAQNLINSGKHLAGSLVTATEPIAVTYSDDLLAAPGAADNGGDQLVPISRYGNDYVHIRTTLTPASFPEVLFLIGSQNNTTITIDDGSGTLRTRVVNAGGLDSVRLLGGRNAQYIHSDKPILAYQIGGSGVELGAGILTPISDCKGANLIAYQYPPAAIQVNFNFIVPTGIEGAFLINGSSTIIQASDFLAVPGFPGWKYCRKSVSASFTPGQTVTIRNTGGKFFFYQNMQTTGGGDFSNFSDFGNVALFPKIARTNCSANPVTLTSGAVAFNAIISSYSWTGPNSFTSSSSDPIIANPVQADSGWHVITVSDNGGCVYKDSVLVSVPLTTISVTPTPAAACAGSTINFTSSSDFAGVTLDSIRWTGPNGFTSTQANFDITNVSVAAGGTYTATYYDRYGCSVSKNTTITVSAAIIANIAISGNTKIGCFNGNSVVLTANGYAQGLSYQTYNPHKAASLFASSNFTKIAPGFYNQAATASGTTTNQINLTGLTGIIPASSVDYGVQYDGKINIATAGDYTFYVNSKDGSNLYIDGALVVSNDGSHAATEVASDPVTLTAGYHSINCNYFNGSTGAGALSVSYSSAVIAKTTIPASLYFSPTAAAPPGLTYTWSNSTTGANTAVTSPGTYMLIGTNGGCSSAASYTVTAIDSYDYGDLPSAWPSAQAKVINCVVGGVPTGPAAAVWAGTGVSYENNIYSDAQAASGNIDGYDDGVVGPGNVNGGISYPFTVTMNSNVTGKTVYFGLWFDWNNNGDFTDDVDLNGNPAFYSGSGVTASPVSVIVTVAVPNGASSSYKSRLIVSDAPVGFADFANTINNGEVEDYQALSILPVNLVSFNAVAQNCKASITWKSATEENFDHYELEYSKDGLLFTTLSTLSGKGNNSEYNYQTGQLDQAAYFRLKSIDKDGRFTYSSVIKLGNICSGKSVNIYPNPVRDFVQVNLTGYTGKVQAQVFNNVGQLIQTLNLVNGGNTISTSELTSGVYNLVIKNETEMQIFKVSVIH